MNAKPTTLIEALQNPQLYEHPVAGFEILETHISWVLLTGSYAYKIKKPVDLGFADFTTLDKRRRYCHEELRLNRRLAPDLYLEVVTITGSIEQPALDGDGEIIDYAVKMHQFPQENLLDRLTKRGELNKRQIDAMADTIAAFHHEIDTAAASSELGSPQQVGAWAEQNFTQMRPLLSEQQDIEQLDQLHAWTQRTEQDLHNALTARKTQGFIRECHGDMHLGNMVLIDDQVVIFDCIDFNEELRWIDVMSEIAFIFMDLYDHNQAALAHRLLDRYLTQTGDYAGLAVLFYYLVYRALVRAKIDLLRLDQHSLSTQQTATVLRDYQKYVALAQLFAEPKKPLLLITHGLSASGKSTLAARLVERLGAVRIRSDVERKRLFDLPADAATGSDLAQGIYTTDATRRTYERLVMLAECLIKAGFSAIIDATCLKHWQRNVFQECAQGLGVAFVILDLEAPIETLRARIQQRQSLHNDPSEADINVLEAQQQSQEPFTESETHYVVKAGLEHSTDAVISGIEKICNTKSR